MKQQIVSTTDADSRTIAYTYDKLGRQLTTTYATGRVTENKYNCCSLLWTKDEDGRYTHYAYDAANRVTDTWVNITNEEDLAGTPLVHYVYDAFGNMQTVTTFSDSSTGRTTTYTYDKNNRVVQIDHPVGLGSEYFEYDDLGSLVGKKDGEGIVTAYEYDDMNRMEKTDYAHGSWPVSTIGTADVTCTYTTETDGTLTVTKTSDVGTSEYVYDMQNRLTSYTLPAPSGREIAYTYNALGQKTSMTNGASVVEYNYYANGWLKRVTDGTTPYAEYAYDAVGNRTNADLGNGAYTEYDYATADPRYMLDEIRHYDSADTLIAEIPYTRDGAGNPLSIGSTSYSYDANSRLASEGSTNFGYDWVGNRNPGTWTYNDADQLEAIPGHSFEYVGNGNLDLERDASDNIAKTYAYTEANLLSAIMHDDVEGDPFSSMEWDSDGNRMSFMSSTGGTTAFVYDTTAGIPAVVEEVLPSEASVYYVREPNGALIARIAGSDVKYYHFDALGSTRLLTSSTGTVTDTYSYDAWGNVTPGGSNVTSQPYQYVGRLGYYTHYQDTNLPMLQLGVRFYDPTLGRFTQVDPVRSELSAYLYVLGNPLSYFDPSGRSPLLDKALKCRNKAAISCGGSVLTDPFNDTKYLSCFAKKFMECMGGAFFCEPYYCLLFPNSGFCTNVSPSNPCMRDQSDKMECGNCCGVKEHCCLLMSAAKGIPAVEGCRQKHTECVINCECGKK